MKKTAFFLVFALLMTNHLLFGEEASKVVLSDVPAETDATPAARPWTGNERAEDVSKYGAVAPVQVPVEYTGKAMDAVVGGIGKVLVFPFELLSRKTKPNEGGQDGKEKS